MLPTLIARLDLLFLIFSVLQAFKLKARTWLVYNSYLMVVSLLLFALEYLLNLSRYFQGTSSAMPGSGPHAYEQDILEEDLDDSPYTPYSYPKKAKAKKGKAMKK